MLKNIKNEQIYFDNDVIYNFEKYLFKFINKPNLMFLQIGAYTGSASLWLVKNILTSNSSKLYDVDVWDEKDEFWGFDCLEKIYDEKTKKYKKIIKHKKESKLFFKNNKIIFDFIYIDGSIKKNNTYNDIKNSFYFLKNNGLIIVDDYYLHKSTIKQQGPRQSECLKFIEENNNILNTEVSKNQIIIEKIKNG
jgi:hypothetical protein